MRRKRVETIRASSRMAAAALDRAPWRVVLAGSFVAGVCWGVFARAWMRFITTAEEFSWSGTLFIVIGFGVAFAAQAGVYLARRASVSRRAFIGLRVLAVVALLPLFAGAGALGAPVLLLAPLALVRRRWPTLLRVFLGAVVLAVVIGVSATFFTDLNLARAVVGSVWFVIVYSGLVWAVCFAFASQDDERLTLRRPASV